ncbi:MAG: calcium-translocating P-type ATPase, PMCA-type [Bacteroidales bacterium]|nr:calcium-translocating P-type ATPase, PMCA-type [Bacteroidales bacterium]
MNDSRGLTAQQVEENRQRYGRNVLTERERQSPWLKLLKKFNDPLIRILLVAAVLSIGISFYEYYYLKEGANVFFEPVGIVVAILLATVLAFWFEYRAEREFVLLTRIDDDVQVKVLREGRVQAIPRRDVVVSDIIVLATGDEIPADGFLLESHNLQVDESSLTGEPMCRKTCDERLFDAAATFPSNRVLRGTNVLEGHAVMQVDAVGDATENGKVFTSVRIDSTVKTPLNEQLDRLSRWISRLSFVLAFLIVAVKIATYEPETDFVMAHFFMYLLKAVMIAVTLIVVAVPEGLPMAVTLSLAYNMRRMLKTHNLVRRLHACETMGAVDVICTDKTGTLTQNRMRVDNVMLCGDNMNPYFLENIVVNSTASLDGDKVVGNPTEGALLLYARGVQSDILQLRKQVTVLDEVPFSTEIKYMASTVESSVDHHVIQYIKGAPEIVLDMCDHIGGNVSREELDAWTAECQRRGMRTIGFAKDKTFIAIVSISDPIRPEVSDAIRKCQEAGIEVHIITGDSPATAQEIGRQLGIDADKIVARARPMDKKSIVEQLRDEQGRVVAVTGDGTNDAPALKAAHVGLSMGDGTAVAKEASDITILDNSFASIVQAVMWGRSLYKNIQRFILFQLTVNVVACVVVFVGAFFGTENPLNVTQMLWVNLIMDTFAAMALASLPPSAEVMKERPRRRHAFIINRRMIANMMATSLIFLMVLGWLLWYFKTHNIDAITDFHHFFQADQYNARLHSYELTFFFTTFVMLQFWNLFNVRLLNTQTSLFHQQWGRGFTSIVLIILFGQVVMVELGGEMLGVVPLAPLSWAVIITATFFINVIIYIINRKLLNQTAI